MRWSLAEPDLLDYTARQMRLFSAKRLGTTRSELAPYIRDTRHRVERCFTQIRRKYYFDGSNTLFDHLHGDHYAAYLYILSNVIFTTSRNDELAARVFLLNKALHGCDIFYGVTLPEVFLLIHPVGTVLGNATYGNYLVAYQNCAVGSLENGTYPVFEGENVLFARAAVLGNCHVGRNVVVAANAFLLDVDVPANSTVVGQYPQQRVLPIEGNVIDRMFR
jgi:serine O-acetyltransferase